MRLWILIASLLCAAPVWAFPSTPILDNFGRGGEELPLGNGTWSGPILPGMQQMYIPVGEQAITSQGAVPASSSSYWSASNFGPGSEVYITIPTWWSNASSDFFIWICGSGENTSSASGYQLYINNAGTWVISRVDNTVGTQLGSTLPTQTISNGDAVALSVSGGVIEAWYKANGGSWVSKGTRSDSTYTSGHIGVSKGYNENISRLDDFGGGTIPGGVRLLTLTGAGQ